MSLILNHKTTLIYFTRNTPSVVFVLLQTL